MTLAQIAGLGKELIVFLRLFVDCFVRQEGRDLLRVYVQGQLSGLQRKTVEAIALQFGKAPRTLQRFLESIKWNEQRLRDRCQQIVAQEHAHAEAIGIIDESGVAKSGKHTTGVSRQWLGSRGKVDNGVVGVHLSYSAPGFQCLLDSELFLPESWANDAERRKQNYVPEEIPFRTKQEIAMVLVDRALANGIQVRAWSYDTFYGRDGKFMDGLEERGQTFVGEIPANFHGWTQKPELRRKAPYLSRRPSCEVQNLVKYSPVFFEQSWERYRIKDTDKGPEVWEIKWSVLWRKGPDRRPGRQHCLIVARNVLSGELKYFLANCVPGRLGVTLRWLLRVAFGRCSVESCLREGKEELGLDHYQVRGWRCIHRHLYVTQLSHLFCARIRQKYDDRSGDQLDRLTVEQVRSAMDTWLDTADMKPAARQKRYEKELDKQRYHQRRNEQARRSHTKTRIKKLQSDGVDPDRIKSCTPKPRE